nr:peroxisomal membrane protein PMP22-like [Ipomoea batatas]
MRTVKKQEGQTKTHDGEIAEEQKHQAYQRCEEGRNGGKKSILERHIEVAWKIEAPSQATMLEHADGNKERRPRPESGRRRLPAGEALVKVMKTTSSDTCQAITAGVLSAISDIVAQKITGIQKLQIKRLILKVWYCNLQSELVSQVFGFAYLGPFGHFLHILLDKIFKGKKDTKTVAKKSMAKYLEAVILMFSGGAGTSDIVPLEQLAFHAILRLENVLEVLPERDFVTFTGRPWVQVKSNIAREYPKVQYTAWTGDIFEPACEDNGNQEGLSVPEKSTHLATTLLYVKRKMERKKSILEGISKLPEIELQARLPMLGAATNKKKTGRRVAGRRLPPERRW